MKNFYKNLLYFGILSIAAASGSAGANVTITYESQPLKSERVPYGNTGLTYSPLTMEFVVSDDGTSLLDWTVSQADTGTLTKALADTQQSNGLRYGQKFIIDTDEFGNLLYWEVNVLKLLEENTGSNAHSVYFLSFSDSFGYPGGMNESLSLYDHQPYPVLMAQSITEGTWSFSQNLPNMHVNHIFNDPNISPVPEPSTYLMLLAGLGLLGFAARRNAAR